MQGSSDSESHALAASESAHHSVGAGVRRAVWRVVRATVVVKAAASEMTSSVAKVTTAHAGHATSAEAAHVASAEATHVASAKAAHMAAATSTTTTVSAATATATATAGLCISGKKAAGKPGVCQNHYPSSSHDILLWNGRDFPPQDLVRRCRFRGRQTPTSRWTEDEDTYLPFLLNSRSIIQIDQPALLEPKLSVRQINSWT